MFKSKAPEKDKDVAADAAEVVGRTVQQQGPDDAWQILSGSGSRGPEGAVGPRGRKGERGPRGEATPTIVSWVLDRARYTAVPRRRKALKGQ